MGEAQIGLSDQASERDTVMAATKTGCLDVIKKIHKETIRVAPPNKTDLFNSTRIFHTLNINKAIVTASFITCVQREREKEKVMNLKKKEKRKRNRYKQEHQHSSRERER